MTVKHRSSGQREGETAQRPAALMNWAAWIALAAGILTCLIQQGDFSDRNLGLMIGIGLIVGGIQILIIGTAMRLFHHCSTAQPARTE